MMLKSVEPAVLQESDYGDEHNTVPGPMFASTTSLQNKQLHGE